MKIVVPNLVSRLNEDRRVESDGFYDGAHGTPVETGIEEINGKFDEKKANLQKDAVTREKSLESEIKYLTEIGPEIERVYRAAQERSGDQMPNVVLPVCIVSLAVVALVAEALLLAPAMDILNVTEPAAQLFTAFGIAGVAGLSFHFVWESLTSETFPKIWKVTCRVVAGMLAVGLVAWGILRGFQLGFAAKLSENPLADFLSSHPILSSIFFVFITLATPVMVATATHFGTHGLRLWWEYRTARCRFEGLSRRRAEAKTQLEARKEALQLGLKSLSEECRQWKSGYTLNHQRGSMHGSIQESYWIVPAKATFAALLALLLAGWFVFFISPFFVLLPVVVWWAAFLYYRRQWRTPSRKEFFDLERVQFVIPAKDVQAADVPIGTFGKKVREELP